MAFCAAGKESRVKKEAKKRGKYAPLNPNAAHVKNSPADRAPSKNAPNSQSRAKSEEELKKIKKKKKADISVILLLSAFLVGLILVLYPSVSNFWNQRVQSKAIENYESILEKLSEDDIAEIFQKADEYNNRIYDVSYPLSNFSSISGYSETLDIEGNGIMGYITIEKINVELPIYHGTSSKVLNEAVGHLEGSSLPVGGPSTHAVLSAHRGLPSAKLFTDLDRLDVGDDFTITIMNKALTYEVDQILIVNPDEIQPLGIEEGKDYCTLLTCTPYGINTHRLLVRGTRVDTKDGKPALFVTADAFSVSTLITTPIVALPMLLFLLVFLIVRLTKKSRKAKRDRANGNDYSEFAVFDSESFYFPDNAGMIRSSKKPEDNTPDNKS